MEHIGREARRVPLWIGCVKMTSITIEIEVADHDLASAAHRL